MTSDTIRRMVMSLQKGRGFMLVDSLHERDKARWWFRKFGGKCQTRKTREGYRLWRIA
jgi:hypothetical protein